MQIEKKNQGLERQFVFWQNAFTWKENYFLLRFLPQALLRRWSYAPARKKSWRKTFRSLTEEKNANFQKTNTSFLKTKTLTSGSTADKTIYFEVQQEGNQDYIDKPVSVRFLRLRDEILVDKIAFYYDGKVIPAEAAEF